MASAASKPARPSARSAGRAGAGEQAAEQLQHVGLDGAVAGRAGGGEPGPAELQGGLLFAQVGARPAKVVERDRLAPPVAGLPPQRQRRLELRQSPFGPAQGELEPAEVREGPRLPGAVAQPAKQGERPAGLVEGLVQPAAAALDQRKAAPRAGFRSQIAEPAGEVEGRLVPPARRLWLAQGGFGARGAHQHLHLALRRPGVAAEGERPFIAVQGLVQGALGVAHQAEVVEGAGLAVAVAMGAVEGEGLLEQGDRGGHLAEVAPAEAHAGERLRLAAGLAELAPEGEGPAVQVQRPLQAGAAALQVELGEEGRNLGLLAPPAELPEEAERAAREVDRRPPSLGGLEPALAVGLPAQPLGLGAPAALGAVRIQLLEADRVPSGRVGEAGIANLDPHRLPGREQIRGKEQCLLPLAVVRRVDVGEAGAVRPEGRDREVDAVLVDGDQQRPAGGGDRPALGLARTDRPLGRGAWSQRIDWRRRRRQSRRSRGSRGLGGRPGAG
jgi:hypothetical protein